MGEIKGRRKMKLNAGVLKLDNHFEEKSLLCDTIVKFRHFLRSIFVNLNSSTRILISGPSFAIQSQRVYLDIFESMSMVKNEMMSKVPRAIFHPKYPRTSGLTMLVYFLI